MLMDCTQSKLYAVDQMYYIEAEENEYTQLQKKREIQCFKIGIFREKDLNRSDLDVMTMLPSCTC